MGWAHALGSSPPDRIPSLAINGGLLPRRDPAQACVNTITVPDLEGTPAAVPAQGGKCVLPRMAVPHVGWLAYCQDLDGNMFGLMQMDAAAA